MGAGRPSQAGRLGGLLAGPEGGRWRHEAPAAAVAGTGFALVDAGMRWPVHPLIAFVMVLAVWALSVVLRDQGAVTGLDGRDCWIAGGLVAAALVVRLASPIFPDFLSGHAPLLGTVSAPAGVHRTPTHDVLGVGAWGLGYPTDPHGCTPVPRGPHNVETKMCGFVFDEVYFPVDALKNLRGVDYFDPEPPLTKLIIAAGISWLGFNPWGWRIMNAILGSLAVGLLYFLARRLWRRDRAFPAMAALFFSLDGLALVESRIGTIDMPAVFFVILAYWLFVLHWHAPTRRAWHWTFYLTALASGLGLAAKADIIPAILLMMTLTVGRWARPALRLGLEAARGRRWHLGAVADSAARRRRREIVPRTQALHYAAGAVVVLACFYLSFFRYWTIAHTVYVNFADTGRGTAVCRTLTTPASVCQLPVAMPLVRHRLGPVTLWLPRGFDPQQSVVDVVMNSVAGYSYQATLHATHPFASPFYTWPLDQKPVLYYAEYSGNGTSVVAGQPVPDYTWISTLGNPVIWWGGLFALATCLWWVLRRRDFVALFILAGFLFGWLVIWSWPSRILFFYEMLGALPFTCLALAYVLSRMRSARLTVRLGTWSLGTLSLAPLALATVVAVVLAFAYFYPLWTGMPIPQPDFQQHVWLPSWY
ncbi:MAG TPA: phospholipid carrier-dependent glycosyltransferase [Candidatus Dormibacteraeota bacterium]|nr:phospholipid carrier-dependent glycosyltransferase [Candidatus Dormibacteraeota bacterium]